MRGEPDDLVMVERCWLLSAVGVIKSHPMYGNCEGPYDLGMGVRTAEELEKAAHAEDQS